MVAPLHISLYMREGNNRLTKTSYKDIIEQLINWCWLINAVLNPQNAEKRRITIQSNSTLVRHNEKVIITRNEKS